MAISQIQSASLASGVPSSSNMPTGSVLQVVQGSTTTQTTSSSTTYTAASGVTATITPKFSTSKILVLVSSTVSSGGGGQYIYTAIAKNGTVTFEGSASYAVGSGTNIWCPCIMSYLDSPATTSATTYAMYFRQANGGLSGNVQVGWGNTINSTVTLMEIAG